MLVVARGTREPTGAVTATVVFSNRSDYGPVILAIATRNRLTTCLALETERAIARAVSRRNRTDLLATIFARDRTLHNLRTRIAFEPEGTSAPTVARSDRTNLPASVLARICARHNAFASVSTLAVRTQARAIPRGQAPR